MKIIFGFQLSLERKQSLKTMTQGFIRWI